MAVDRTLAGPRLQLRRRRLALTRTARRLVAAEWAPPATLVAGTLLIAAAAAWVAVRVSVFALDETLIKASAVHYTHGLPSTLFHDLNARGTSRLYSLIISPLFRVFDGDVAVRAARVLNTLLFTSTSIPVYLLARRATVGRWASVAAGLLSIAVPWLTLSTALYTENAAFPLFLWTFWAAERAVRAPSARRDLLALVLITATTCARTQLGILFVAYFACVFAAPFAIARARGSALADATPALWHRVRRGHPFTVAVLGLGLVALLWFAVRGRLHHEVQVVFGSYSEIQDRGQISPDMAMGILVEVLALSIGIGLIPAIVAFAWYGQALRRGTGDAGLFAFVTVVFVVVFALATVYAQGGYLGTRTEERYYLYAMPFLWIGAMAALSGRGVITRRSLWTVGLALTLLFAVVPIEPPLNTESSFLGPVLSSVNHLTPQVIDHIGIRGLSPRDLLFVIAGLVTVAVAVVWPRWPRVGRGALVAAALAVQFVLAFYAFQVVRGHIYGIPTRVGGDFAAFGWVDRTLGNGAQASWLNNQPRADGAAADAAQRETLFYNDDLVRSVQVPELALPSVNFPLSGLPVGSAAVHRADATFALPPGFAGPVIQDTTSPLVQLAGKPLGHSADGSLELIAAPPHPAVRWAALGLTAEGWVPQGKAVRLTTAGRRLAITLLAPAKASAEVVVRAGDATKRVRLKAAATPRPVTLHLDACGARSGALRGTGGTKLPDGRRVVALVQSVRVSPAPC